MLEEGKDAEKGVFSCTDNKDFICKKPYEYYDKTASPQRCVIDTNVFPVMQLNGCTADSGLRKSITLDINPNPALPPGKGNTGQYLCEFDD